MDLSTCIVLGRLTKPHSIKGEVRIEYFADAPELLDKPLWIRAGREEPRPARIASWRVWREQVILRLEGVDDRSAAELLRGQEILISETDMPPPDPDEPYIRDIIGLAVELADGSPLGILEDVLFLTDQEIWSIRDLEGREILLPAVPEFVEDIDLERGAARIAPPPGLLEIYQAKDA